MAKVTKSNTTIVSGATTINKNSAITVFSQAINLDGAIGLALHATYNWGTAPTAGKQLDFYLEFSNDNSTWDTGEAAILNQIASYALTNDTSANTVTIIVDGALCVPKYARVAVFTNEVTYDGSMTSLIATVATAA